MTFKSDLNFEKKLTFCLKNYMRNLVNFNTSSGNSQNLHFDGGYFCRKYIMFELRNTEELCREKWVSKFSHK